MIRPFAVIILLSVALGGCAYTTSYQYDYQAQPPPAPPGTPALPPVLITPPPPVPYKTFYESKWDDPTLVVGVNQSARLVRVKIDDEPEIVLGPYQSTADLHLGVGEHRVRATLVKQTAMGAVELVRFLSLIIRPEGRSQIFYVYE